ncbi:MAG: DUF4956 domain-containing protein [Clostridia bacterium]|nr:DUF4956 domain-containing protein [Clostridia bacterium]MBQ4396309.1 DUF4956 domain-containing protein [Clostridia bacterium]
MLEKLFTGIFESGSTAATQTISLTPFLICMASSLLIGSLMALAYKHKTRCSQSFVITLAILPAAIAMVIMLVNGNVGAGVAVAGAFGLVRFRSVPGTAKEIGAIFTAMAAGLACGMGYIGFAALFAAIVCTAMLAMNAAGFGLDRHGETHKRLNVTIPEDLDYTNLFDDLFARYTRSHRLVTVKTTNMGSLFKLTYHIELNSADVEKQLMDEMRCRNGNLEINITEQQNTVNEL